MDASWNPYERLSPKQREQLLAFERLLLGFNRKVNLVSRETEALFEERHTLHSLALAWRQFPPGSGVVDWGTGGGLPLIPLAICFPDVMFYGVDAVEKKLNAVHTMARRLGLDNVRTWHGRAETWPGQADYAVSRATAPLVNLWHWSIRSVVSAAPRPESAADAWTSELIVLKGGDLREEIEALEAVYSGLTVTRYPIRLIFKRAYFEGKYIVCVSRARSA